MTEDFEAEITPTPAEPRAGAKAGASEPDLGELPNWNLNDLYPAIDSPEVDRDLKSADEIAAAFAADYQGKLAELVAHHMTKHDLGQYSREAENPNRSADRIRNPAAHGEGYYQFVEAIRRTASETLQVIQETEQELREALANADRKRYDAAIQRASKAEMIFTKVVTTPGMARRSAAR